MSVRSRYDGHADWYDAYLERPLYDAVPGIVERLVEPGRGLCVDAACGTGVHLQRLADRGWDVVGIDLSADQLRMARVRWNRVVRADVGRVPLADGAASCVVSVLALTDFDDVPAFFREAVRVLRPRGRLVLLAVHPCFITPFTRMEDGTDGAMTIHPGYWTTERVFEGPGIGTGLRSRVGVRHLPLSHLLNALLGSGLRLERVEEHGDWTVPWLLSLVATKG